jgi:diguanylate cyclase (GGDEF)-like protein
VVTAFQDITAQRRHEVQLVQHSRELERLNESLAESQRSLAAQSRQLEHALTVSREAARRDALTGALNHGAIVDELRTVIASGATRVAVAMIDVDGMKTANDTYGHQAGDLVLKRVTHAARRNGAVVGRYGGDEFLALLPGADASAADAYRRAVEADLRDAHVVDPGSGARVRVIASVGVAVFPDDGADLMALIEKADEAMYEAKQQRRDGAALQAGARTETDQRLAVILGECLTAVSRDCSLDEKLKLMAHRLMMRLEYAGVNIDLFATSRERLDAQNAFVRAPSELIDAWLEEQRNGGEKPIGSLLALTRAPIVLDDLANDERLTPAQRSILTAAGMGSGAAVPLLSGDRIIGVLAAGREAKRAVSAADAELLMHLASQLAPLLDLLAHARADGPELRAA